jgi:hypothetical protein
MSRYVYIRGAQDAGLGSTHFNVAAPRHLSGLRPGNQSDPVLLSRLSAPSHVPAWVSNKEKTEALYSLALCEESKRLVEKDANDERVKTQQVARLKAPCTSSIRPHTLVTRTSASKPSR